jgi:hypothetical protein
MGIFFFEFGNSVSKTWADHAPAAIKTLAQGMSVSASVSVLRIRMLDSSSRVSACTEITFAGWWS